MSDPARDLVDFMAAHVGEIPAREFQAGLVALQDYIDALGEIEIVFDPSIIIGFQSADGDEKAVLKFQDIDSLALWASTSIQGRDACYNHQNQKSM